MVIPFEQTSTVNCGVIVVRPAPTSLFEMIILSY
jgi:hypothetical protein